MRCQNAVSWCFERHNYQSISSSMIHWDDLNINAVECVQGSHHSPELLHGCSMYVHRSMSELATRPAPTATCSEPMQLSMSMSMPLPMDRVSVLISFSISFLSAFGGVEFQCIWALSTIIYRRTYSNPQEFDPTERTLHWISFTITSSYWCCTTHPAARER